MAADKRVLFSEEIIVDGVGIGGLKIRELLTPLSSRGSVIHDLITSFRPISNFNSKNIVVKLLHVHTCR